MKVAIVILSGLAVQNLARRIVFDLKTLYGALLRLPALGSHEPQTNLYIRAHGCLRNLL